MTKNDGGPLSPAQEARMTDKIDAAIEQVMAARQQRAERLYDLVQEAREIMRARMSPAVDADERKVFDLLQALHYGLGGDPFDMHMRAALSALEPFPAPDMREAVEALTKAVHAHYVKAFEDYGIAREVLQADPEVYHGALDTIDAALRSLTGAKP